jgi:hypothetical protein
MDLILAAACDQARERDDGKLDLIGVFGELSAPGFPAAQERMVAVFILEWTEAEHGRQELRAELRDEAGRAVLTIEGHTDVISRGRAGARPRTQLIVPLEHVVFPAAGRYRFELTAAGATIPAFTLLVEEHQEEADPAAAPRV